MDEDDWRLMGQERYLLGRELRWSDYAPPRADWDHDHCAFCSAKFAATGSGDADFTTGYVTADDDYHWICAPCFEDFRQRFAWTVLPA